MASPSSASVRALTALLRSHLMYPSRHSSSLIPSASLSLSPFRSLPRSHSLPSLLCLSEVKNDPDAANYVKYLIRRISVIGITAERYGIELPLYMAHSSCVYGAQCICNKRPGFALLLERPGSLSTLLLAKIAALYLSGDSSFQLRVLCLKNWRKKSEVETLRNFKE